MTAPSQVELTHDARLDVRGLTVTYLGRKDPALAGVSASVAAGEVVGVAGRTGAGKSTLALASAGFIPRVQKAKVSGSILIGGVSALTATATDLAGRVGIVFSTPALQLSGSKLTVREELAFGLENLGVDQEAMDARIDEALEHLDISPLADRNPQSLSGGEQQRVAIASIVVMRTQVLALDEPTAQLDPEGAASVATLLRTLAADGRAVLCVEQAFGVLGRMDRCLVLEAGRVATDGRPGAALGSGVLEPLGLAPPTLVALAEAAALPPDRAFDEAAIAAALTGRRPLARGPIPGAAPPLDVPPLPPGTEASVEARGLVHRYPGGIEAIRGVELSIAPGESVAIVGQNGSGKTTLVKHFNGLLRPTAGTVAVAGRLIEGRPVSEIARQVGFVFQNPDDQLFQRSVEREVAFGPRNQGLDAKGIAERTERALELAGIVAERGTNPYDLGPSVRKLVALASILANEPPVLVLDEPTTGQDGPGKVRVGQIVDAWSASGRTVIAITHDMEFAARHFRRVVVMRGGEVVLDGSPTTVFAPGSWDVLASTGLAAPPAVRVAAAMGLDLVPPDAESLLRALASAT
jgi:energy-coupling factor transport system ATP-binding protein